MENILEENIAESIAYQQAVTKSLLRIKQGRTNIALSANIELVKLYWDIGQIIHDLQESEGWGSNFVNFYAKDLQKAHPEMTGFSRSNVFRIRAFFLTYKDLLQGNNRLINLPFFQISWSHNLTLIEKLGALEERIWYARKVIECNWSKRALDTWIRNDLYSREGKAISNYLERLPIPQSYEAHNLLKDPYVLELNLSKDRYLEKEIEKDLVKDIQTFLLELGQGFAFLGSQYRLEIGKKTHFLDMLFYHTKLHCYVVIELKRSEFKPIDAGQLNFYLSAVDDQLREEGDQPTIGILLCQDKDQLEVEYALRDLNKPIGVASFEIQMRKSLPIDLQGALPSEQEFVNNLIKSKVNH